jgi:hypothetical protein
MNPVGIQLEQDAATQRFLEEIDLILCKDKSLLQAISRASSASV